MRAPVYRHIESVSTIAGLSLNGFIGLLAVALVAIRFLNVGVSIAVVALAYAALRLMGRGRPPLYWQHLLLWRYRQWRHEGRLSAMARAPAPEFPFGPSIVRDRRTPA